MANKYAMENLKKEGAIRVYDGMKVFWPQFQQEESLTNVQELVLKFNGCYATNNSTAAFVSDGEMYVTPFTRETLYTLCCAGFRYADFYVPFSNWDHPMVDFEKAKWNLLREKAEQVRAEEFVAECNKYCDSHHIGAISENTLSNCFQIPDEGVVIKRFGYEERYYPYITRCLDCVAIEKIGRFCTNNGRVVFVYRDGKTYVTKGYGILSELRAAGYKETGLFVPFSNGEIIQDPVLKARWDSISK